MNKIEFAILQSWSELLPHPALEQGIGERRESGMDRPAEALATAQCSGEMEGDALRGIRHSGEEFAGHSGVEKGGFVAAFGHEMDITDSTKRFGERVTDEGHAGEVRVCGFRDDEDSEFFHRIFNFPRGTFRA